MPVTRAQFFRRSRSQVWSSLADASWRRLAQIERVNTAVYVGSPYARRFGTVPESRWRCAVEVSAD